MPIRFSHYSKHLLQIVQRNPFMKQVAHRIYKNNPGLAPIQRLINNIRLKRGLERISITRLAHRLEALRHPFCIAVLAAWADFGATRYGIPGCVGPFD